MSTPAERPSDRLVESKFIVLRPSADLPKRYMPPDLNGRWFDRGSIPLDHGQSLSYAGPGIAQASAVATGRFEVRDDGAVTEVYEVQRDCPVHGEES